MQRGLVCAVQDSGGYTASGEVPRAQPIQVAGERQLRAEVDGLIRQLSADEEWTRRIDALLRVEGLVRGGATGVPGFAELLKTLQEPIVVQVLDRCVHMLSHACVEIVSFVGGLGGSRRELPSMHGASIMPAYTKRYFESWAC